MVFLNPLQLVILSSFAIESVCISIVNFVYKILFSFFFIHDYLFTMRWSNVKALMLILEPPAIYIMV